MNLRIGILFVVATLLASCSVVNKNGYYQSRKYNIGKPKLKQHTPKQLESSKEDHTVYSQQLNKADESPTETPIYLTKSSNHTTGDETVYTDIQLHPKVENLEKSTVIKPKAIRVTENKSLATNSVIQLPTKKGLDEPTEPVEKEEPILAYIALGFVGIILYAALTGITSLSGLIAIIFLSLAATITGFTAKRQFKKNPSKYKNTWAISLVSIFSWISLLPTIVAYLYLIGRILSEL